VEFDFREMNEDDYHGVKSLLSQAATGPLSTITGLADTIVSQVNIGTVVSTGDSEAGACSFGTILNINQNRTKPGMDCVHSLLTDISRKNPKASKLVKRFLSDHETVPGLLIKERLINFPFELAPNIHKVLIEDVNWSGSDEYEPESGERREDYQFTHLLVLSTFEIEGKASSSSMSSQPPQAEGIEQAEVSFEGMGHKKKRKLDKKSAIASRIYHHWEDEVLFEKALFSHSWQNPNKSEVVRSNRKYQSYNMLYAIKWSDYVDTIASLEHA
jgi:hypothetical protein